MVDHQMPRKVIFIIILIDLFARVDQILSLSYFGLTFWVEIIKTDAEEILPLCHVVEVLDLLAQRLFLGRICAFNFVAQVLLDEIFIFGDINRVPIILKGRLVLYIVLGILLCNVLEEDLGVDFELGLAFIWVTRFVPIFEEIVLVFGEGARGGFDNLIRGVEGRGADGGDVFGLLWVGCRVLFVGVCYFEVCFDWFHL